MSRTIVNIVLIVGFMATVGWLAPRVMITTILMVVGVVVASLVRAAVAHDPKPFRWPFVFHKCCVTIHWAFISFYVFSFDSLRKNLRFSPFDIEIMIVLSSILIYTIGNLITRTLLDAPNNPGFLSTNRERENVLLAAISLTIALVFATKLIQHAVPGP